MDELRKKRLINLATVFLLLAVVFSLVAGFFAILISVFVTGVIGVTIGINKKDNLLTKISVAAIILSIIASAIFGLLVYHSNM